MIRNAFSKVIRVANLVLRFPLRPASEARGEGKGRGANQLNPGCQLKTSRLLLLSVFICEICG